MLESQQHFNVIFFINDYNYSTYTVSTTFQKGVFMTGFISSQQTYQFLLCYLLKHYRLLGPLWKALKTMMAACKLQKFPCFPY